MDLEKEREVFSHWHESFHKTVVNFGSDGNPECHIKNDRWRAWQAAKAQAVPDGYRLVPVKLLTDINNIAVDELHRWDVKNEVIPSICELMQDLSFYITNKAMIEAAQDYQIKF